uniref:Uncharacterized protein n=1 Tax=Leptocylindrus danicus TaxID=163516 RepID=A0A7S2JR03_9STRA|mmetsp:Transcript_10540/g.15819  ORF Transcript_10540/g.15819 Transcript_10540/m.15819 type:complete len:280 (+) Transcript_10540:207-1046(+)
MFICNITLSQIVVITTLLLFVNPSSAASIRGTRNSTSALKPDDEQRNMKEKPNLQTPLNSTNTTTFQHKPLRASPVVESEALLESEPITKSTFYTLIELNAVISSELRTMASTFVETMAEFDAIVYNNKNNERRRGVFKQYFTKMAHELDYEGEFLSSVTIYSSYDYCQVLSVVFNDIAAFLKKQSKILASNSKRYRRLARYADGKADAFKILSTDLGRLTEGTTPTAIATVLNGNMQELANLISKQEMYFEAATLPYEENVLGGVIEAINKFIELLAD